jgi:hypothetical protein
MYDPVVGDRVRMQWSYWVIGRRSEADWMHGTIVRIDAHRPRYKAVVRWDETRTETREPMDSLQRACRACGHFIDAHDGDYRCLFGASTWL